MNRITSRSSPRRLVLTGSLLLLPAIATSATAASAIPLAGATVAVANCNDAGPGSLRSAVAAAASGDIIDMSALPCRLINLTSGAIAIAQDDLSIVGAAHGVTEVDAGQRSSVFRHSGTGTLRMERMDLARGLYTTNIEPYGGCLYSAGNVEVVDSLVRGCRANGIKGVSLGDGGGIFALGSVKLVRSRVVDNASIHGNDGAIATGGGLIAFSSRICRNRVHGPTGSGAPPQTIVTALNVFFAQNLTYCDNEGGGLYVRNGTITIADSAFYGNTGPSILHLSTPNKGDSVTIFNTTISGNTDTSTYGAPFVELEYNGLKSISNSTIAFNQLSSPYAAAVRLSGSRPTVLDSTIISDNVSGSTPTYSILRTGSSSTELVGANNLIRGPSPMTLPADTLTADPQLAALADNGGPTVTHALPAGSPAIDSGNNEAGLDFDQRGKGHPRVNGSQADIGAYER